MDYCESSKQGFHKLRQMANIGCLLVCTFGNFLVPILIAAHTANNVDFGDEPENEDYESEGP